MASRAVTRRQAAANEVAAAARQHADDVARRLAPRWAAAAAAEGRPEIDLAGVQLVLARMLDDDRRALEAADEADIEELRADRPNRERRDRAFAELRSRLSQIRRSLEASHGPGAGERLLALRGRTPRTPGELRLEARRVIGRLRGDGGPLPAPDAGALAPEPAPALWADRLEAPLAELEAAMGSVHADRREREGTYLVKHEALAAFDRTYGAAAALLAALYRLAGLDGYARRLRPRPARPRSDAAAAAAAAEGSGRPRAGNDAPSPGASALRAALRAPAARSGPAPAPPVGAPAGPSRFPAPAVTLPAPSVPVHEPSAAVTGASEAIDERVVTATADTTREARSPGRPIRAAAAIRRWTRGRRVRRPA